MTSAYRRNKAIIESSNSMHIFTRDYLRSLLSGVRPSNLSAKRWLPNLTAYKRGSYGK